MARWPCFICGAETYEVLYTEVDGYRRGSNPWTCAACVAQLMAGWHRFFPKTGHSLDESGVIVTWNEMKIILDKFERDTALRIHTYQVTDQEARSIHESPGHGQRRVPG